MMKALFYVFSLEYIFLPEQPRSKVDMIRACGHLVHAVSYFLGRFFKIEIYYNLS